jgi:hypothetical protein
MVLPPALGSPINRVSEAWASSFIGRPILKMVVSHKCQRYLHNVDCVLLIGPDFPHDAAAEAELLAGLPFINMELVDPRAFQQFTERTFATDRNLVRKGMVEVVS